MQNIIVWSIPTVVYYNNYFATSYTQQIRVQPTEIELLTSQAFLLCVSFTLACGLMSLGTRQSNNLAGLWGGQPVGCVNH